MSSTAAKAAASQKQRLILMKLQPTVITDDTLRDRWVSDEEMANSIKDE